MATQNPNRNKYDDCPHCSGTTKCSCGSCGVKYTTEKGGEAFTSGICKVCKGRGFIPKG